MDLNGREKIEVKKSTRDNPNRRDRPLWDLATEIWKWGGKERPFMMVYKQVERLGLSRSLAKWKDCENARGRVKCFMSNSTMNDTRRLRPER